MNCDSWSFPFQGRHFGRLCERHWLLAADGGLALACYGDGCAVRCSEFDFVGLADSRWIVCHGYFLSKEGISYWVQGAYSAPQIKAALRAARPEYVGRVTARDLACAAGVMGCSVQRYLLMR